MPGPPQVRLGWHPIWSVLGVALLLSTAVIAIGAVVRAPYVVFAPGSAIDTEPIISTPGTEAFEDDGEVLFLTVSLRGASQRVGYGEAALGWLRGDEDVFPRDAILGGQTGDESREQSLQEMTVSQEVAAKVALEHLGYEVASRGRGAVVTSTVPGSPAATDLRPGDVIVAVDGTDIDLDSQLRGELDGREPGDQVALSVDRGGSQDPVDVTTRLIADPDGSDRALLGVSVFTRDLSFDLPFTVRIDTNDVGGPSAGLALTLGLIDHLTPGSLTGGQVIATTGTMDPDGRVGVVGGVAQKAAAAIGAGARLILVPESEADEARAHAGDVTVVGVATLDDALEALTDIGGNADELDRDGGP